MKWRWAKDTFLTPDGAIRLDKQQHFAGCFGFYVVARLCGATKKQATLTVLLSGIAWEVKDALIPYEKYGWWGGDGFSWRDCVTNVAGWFFGYTIVEFIESVFLNK